MGLAIAPQLVGNNGLETLRAAIAAPERYAIEPKVDGVRGLVAFEGEGITIRNRKGMLRERWLACHPFRRGLERLADALPIVREGTVLDGELTAGSFQRTMAVLRGAWPFEASLRLVVFDMPVFAGLDLRFEPWEDRRRRLETLAQAFAYPLELSPVVEPSADLSAATMDGYLEGIVLKDRTAEYRSGSRRGWSKVKSPDWFERHRARFGRKE